MIIRPACPLPVNPSSPPEPSHGWSEVSEFTGAEFSELEFSSPTPTLIEFNHEADDTADEIVEVDKDRVQGAQRRLQERTRASVELEVNEEGRDKANSIIETDTERTRSIQRQLLSTPSARPLRFSASQETNTMPLQFCYPNGACELSALSSGVPQLGLVLQGEAAGDDSGGSVSDAGDINGDGVMDLVIGAWGASPGSRYQAGKSYVVFGSRNASAWGDGILDLGSLSDGRHGFVLQGEATGDDSGGSVSGAGDINGDGVMDLVIGAWGAPGFRYQAGKSYVVFGSRNVSAWGNGILDLGSLSDGRHGFVLQGVAGDGSGGSVSGAGDINGDGVADLVIGAPYASRSGRNWTGQSYVVFGSKNASAWGNGVLNLSSLCDGYRGFVLQGEAAGDQSGTSVSGVGDINGDGMADLVIGAPNASPSDRATQAGKSYVIFGSKNVSIWGNGSLELSSMNDGRRGFVLQGEASGDKSGHSVNGAGDINGDGVVDLVIGAYGASPGGRTGAGQSYVVFGSKNVSAWGNGVLELRKLHDGYRGFVLQGETADDASGMSVSGAGDINGDGVADLVIGANYASPSGRMWAGKSYIAFGSRNRAPGEMDY